MVETIEKKKGNYNWLIFLIGALCLIGGLLYIEAKQNNLPPAGNTSTTSPNGPAQVITLSEKNYNYYPQIIRVKEGQLVRIFLDRSVAGCLRSFTIPEFGVQKNLDTPQDSVEFTPNKKGTFRFACSMNMGTGTIIVE